MASIRREVVVRVPVDKAWASLRRVELAHKLFAGVLVSGSIEGDVRTVKFANGMVVRERIIDIDDVQKRIAYTVLDGLFEHHSASMQIAPLDTSSCLFIWVSDFLPNERRELVEPLVAQGCQALKHNLEEGRA